MQKSSSEKTPSLRRVLGVFDGIAILIGITIGAGIYSTPQIIAVYLSSFPEIITLWIIVGIFVYIGGLVYAELGSRLPSTGGEYVYISRAFGPYAGFIFGWAQLFIIRTSPLAGLALISANYLGYFVVLTPIGHTITALLFIALFGTLNYIGIQQASFYQKVSTIIKIGGLFVLAVSGLVLAGGGESLMETTAAPTADLGPVGNIVAALMLIVFTHTGWDRVGYAAGEMKDPKRVIPLSMFAGIAIIVLLYWSVNLLYYYTLGIEGLRNSTIVASDVATQLMGPLGAALISVLVIISATGSMNGTMMTAPRVYYAMARDGLFFRWLNFVHPKFHTPSRAIIAHCLWAAVILIVRGQFETIVAGMVFAILIFYAATTLALFKFRQDEKPAEDVYKMPFYPVLPLVYLLGILSLIILRAFFEWEKSLVDLTFIATGIPFAVYWVARSRK